jgi:type IV pilus assembly protein PilA
MYDRKGFTLIEMLIVVVIIGLLAAIAIPKFATSKDRAKLASLRTDLRNLLTAEETYFSDNQTYGTMVQIQSAGYVFNLSPGNTGGVTPSSNGYTATFSNASILTGSTQCQVQVGAGATATLDGVVTCP